MPRNFQEVHRRLQQAALELFRERGYDQTTAAEIAAWAGVTERTFFRHFPDKRDILFDGQERLQTVMTDAIVGAPADFTPMQTLRLAFHSVKAIFEENRPVSEPRQKVIAATPALREREAGKIASMTAALAVALEQRGVDARLAKLAVQVGAAAFGYALAAWFENASDGLDIHLDRAFNQVRELSADHEPAEPLQAGDNRRSAD